MRKGKEMGKAVIAAAAMLAVALLLSGLLHGLTQCLFPDPLGWEDMQYLDSFTLADSTVVLQQSLEGETVLLEYQKNWLLPRYALMALHPVWEGYTTAVVTPLAAYPVTVEGNALSIGEQKMGIRWGEFFDTYGTGTIALLAAQCILYWKWKKK